MTPWSMMQLRRTAAMAAPDMGGGLPAAPDAPGMPPGQGEAPNQGAAPQDAARQREESLSRREADVTRRELRAQALEALTARQLPAELADLIDYSDAKACTASLSRVQKIWQQAVQKGVESRVAGAAPKTGTGKGGAHGTMRDAISAYYNK